MSNVGLVLDAGILQGMARADRAVIAHAIARRFDIARATRGWRRSKRGVWH